MARLQALREGDACTEHELSSGTRLDGYVIEGVLGRGSLGVTYRARDVADGSSAALKLLTGRGAAGAPLLRRFLAQAARTGDLEHPSLLAPVDTGQLNGVPYVVSPLVAAPSLAALMADGGNAAGRSFDLAAAARLVASCARALQVAHDGGIVHADLRPEHVLVQDDETPVILDFGLARGVEEGAPDDEERRSWRAPELDRQAPVVAADVWSLGRLLQTCCERLGEAPGAVHLRESLEELACEALAPDPLERPARADRLAQRIDDLLHDSLAAPARATTSRRAPEGRLAAACLALVALLPAWFLLGTSVPVESDPPGQHVLVDGRDTGLVTPARVSRWTALTADVRCVAGPPDGGTRQEPEDDSGRVARVGDAGPSLPQVPGEDAPATARAAQHEPAAALLDLQVARPGLAGRAMLVGLDVRGCLVARDAADGQVRWRTRLAAGAPRFLATARAQAGRAGPLVLSGDARLAVVALDSGRVLWERAVPEDAGPALVADLVGDGRPEILQATRDGRVAARALEDGSEIWNCGRDVPDGEARGPACAGVGDLDGDGRGDLVVGCEDGFLYARFPRSDTRSWMTRVEGHLPRGVRVLDADRDGALEVLVLDTSGRLTLLAGTNGLVRSRFRITDARTTRGAPWPRLLCGDVAGSAAPEVVMLEPDGVLRVLEPLTGLELWRARGSDRTAGPALLADVDGDGRNEVIVAAAALEVRDGGTGECVFRQALDMGVTAIAPLSGGLLLALEDGSQRRVAVRRTSLGVEQRIARAQRDGLDGLVLSLASDLEGPGAAVCMRVASACLRRGDLASAGGFLQRARAAADASPLMAALEVVLSLRSGRAPDAESVARGVRAGPGAFLVALADHPPPATVRAGTWHGPLLGLLARFPGSDATDALAREALGLLLGVEPGPEPASLATAPASVRETFRVLRALASGRDPGDLTEPATRQLARRLTDPAVRASFAPYQSAR